MCYDDVAPLYEARGYHPLPVDPKDKFPVYLKADGTYGKAAGWTTERVPLRAQGKANIGIRTGTDIGVVGVDVDTDDPVIQAALPAIVRDSLVKKKGQRGYTSFLFGPGTKSRKFLIDGKTVVEILGVGRQTVIPPSVHPVTQKPYEWVGEGFELLDVEPARDLAHVPADFEKLVEEALRPFGYKDEPERSTAKSDDNQAPHRQLNDFARANLQRWVPDLGLKKYRRKRGPHLAYEAVATWRPSTQGKELQDRDYNLSITSKSGITDFGVDRSYTPLDLVMAARTLNLSDSFVWLDDKLGWSAGGPEIVIPGPWEGSDRNARPEEPEAPPQEDGGKPRAPKGLGPVWYYGAPLPPRPKFLVPGIVPQGPTVGIVGGQWSTAKSFALDDLIMAVLNGGKFIGETAVQGGVLFVELEASDSEARLYGAGASHGVGPGELPLVFIKERPPSILLNARKTNPEFMKWGKLAVDHAKAIARWHGTELVLVAFDCLTRFAGFEDESSPSECQRVMDALIALAEYAGCLLLVVDHFGKNMAAGVRGGSPKETNATVVLATGEKPKNVYDTRTILIRKMRNGRDGLEATFQLEPCDVEVDQEVVDDDGVITIERQIVKTLRVRWLSQMHPAGAEEQGEPDNLSEQERRALMVLSDLINKHGEELPPECEAPKGLQGAREDAWEKKLVSKRVLGGKNSASGYAKLRNSMFARKLIDVDTGFVWVPL
jgi:AAA domain/Bifunctional DNA primase/polymerase, N-terminal